MNAIIYKIFLFFFISHIPITILFDSRVIFPQSYYPKFACQLFDWYISNFHDPIMTPPHPPWLSAIILFELIFQLPFFFVAVYALTQSKFLLLRYSTSFSHNQHSTIFSSFSEKNWIKTPGIIYGSHVITTMIPVLAHLFHNSTPTNLPILLGFYLPYLILPTLWVVVLLSSSNQIFRKSDSSLKKTQPKKRNPQKAD
eukprot:Sdes_comp20030_c0_seq1m12790